MGWSIGSIFSGLVCLVAIIMPAYGDEYPWREEYKGVALVSQEQLAKELDQYTVIDIRSKLEYEVLHIEGAVNFEYDHYKFHNNVKALYAEQRKPIVFYTGSKYSSDSYHAAQSIANILPQAQVFAYDGGILEWTDWNLSKTVYRGKSPAKATDLITLRQYQERLLKPMIFEKTMSDKYVVLDVRTHQERDGVGLFFGHEKWVGINKYRKLVQFLKTVKDSGKPLLVFDDAGDKTRILQYELNRMGVKEYYFMEGGASAYFNMVASMHYRSYEHGQVAEPQASIDAGLMQTQMQGMNTKQAPVADNTVMSAGEGMKVAVKN
ncbi:MAG: rhodanese-like domain-containing protein [Gammaproteobacteria bacterium]|nr:rhodanese-like domain-containing protein [Gammaproteobacteria bacterium]